MYNECTCQVEHGGKMSLLNAVRFGVRDSVTHPLLRTLDCVMCTASKGLAKY